MNKSFFAGTEEVVSRLISAFLGIIFFLVYVSAKDSGELVLNWSDLLVTLALFWLVYEFLAYTLYFIFVYFSKQNQVPEKLIKQSIDKIEIEDDTNNSLKN